MGDAVGTALEFCVRDSQPRLEGMEGGGPFLLPPGYWTDDTAMALALADSLAASEALDARDLMDRFVRWWQDGEYSCRGHCFDIGNTTRTALDRYLRTREPLVGSADPGSAGNGSLMRLAPVALRFWQDRERLDSTAAEQSRTTHGAEEAVDACRAFAELLADVIGGSPRAKPSRQDGSRVRKRSPRSWPEAGGDGHGAAMSSTPWKPLSCRSPAPVTSRTPCCSRPTWPTTPTRWRR